MLKVKQPNKRRNIYHFSQFVNDFSYYKFEEYYVRDKEGNRFKGYMYWLDDWYEGKRMDIKLLNSIAEKYDNVELFEYKSEYAPEQVGQLIFIAF